MVMRRPSFAGPGFVQGQTVRRNRHRSHGRDSAGFSLMEMLVALALVGLMSSLIVDVYSHLKTIRTLQEQTAMEANAAAVAAYMATDIGRALTRPLIDMEADEIRYLDGKSDSVRFVAVIRTGFGTEELREVEFSWRGPKSGLWRRSITRRGAEELRKATVVSELLDVGLAKVSFEFLRQSSTDSQWEDHWQHSRMLPRAVRINVSGMGPRGGFKSTSVAKIN